MPLTPTAAKGSVGLMLEGTSGMQLLLANTAVIATVTGITAPTGSTGMKLYIRITGWTTSGTFTINGTGSPGNTETVTVAAPTTQQLQGAQIASFDYVSVNNYTAITNITTTGMTNGFITVYGIQAAKFNVPISAFKSIRKVPTYSPSQYTGLMARDVKLVATHSETMIDSFDSDFYADLSLYWVYLLIGSPTWSTIPATPTSLLATTALTSSPVALTSQPLAPSQKLIITATGYTATPVTLTITGTSYGVAGTTETILINANGTYYSANAYSAVSPITTSTNASGVSIAVTGVFGWKGTVTSETTRYTASVEHFDGTASWIHPFFFATDGDYGITTSGIGLGLKGLAQDKIAIGDRTTNPLNTNRTTSIGFPTGDTPIGGWQTNVYLDDITGTAGTTIFLDAQEEIKLNFKHGAEQHWTFNNTQVMTRAYPLKTECMIDVSYDIINLLQNEKWRQNLKQYLYVQTLGEYIGTTGGVQYFKGWTWTLPLRYDGEYNQEGSPEHGNVGAKPKLRTEYDAATGGSFLLTIITRQPPTYPN